MQYLFNEDGCTAYPNNDVPAASQCKHPSYACAVGEEGIQFWYATRIFPGDSSPGFWERRYADKVPPEYRTQLLLLL